MARERKCRTGTMVHDSNDRHTREKQCDVHKGGASLLSVGSIVHYDDRPVGRSGMTRPLLLALPYNADVWWFMGILV